MSKLDRKYLGEFPVESPPMSKEEFLLNEVLPMAQMDGAHHKTWVADQTIRVLLGCPIEFKMAKWDDGLEELRWEVGENQAYLDWVEDYEGGGEYEYDKGY